MKRRDVLFSLGAAASAAPIAETLGADLRGYPNAMELDPRFEPSPLRRGSTFQVLTRNVDRRTVSAIFDRLIPADDLGPSATEAGCVEFLDSQLAGPFGKGATLFRSGPKAPGEDALMQKPQFISTPRERYETGLQALEAYCQVKDGKSFADLPSDRQDQILAGMEDGSISLSSTVNTQALFALMLMNVREGYFSDPIYGGNKDMAGWKMIGFPGARYDYRRYADRTGHDLKLEPVSLIPKD